MNIREAKSSDVKDITKVHVESWKTTYKNIFPVEFLETINFDKRYKLWEKILNHSGDELVYLLEFDNKVVGFLSAGPAREESFDYEAEIYALYVLEDYQNKGLGQKLFETALDYIKNKGYESIYVWVLKDNPSVEFYKKMGGKKIRDSKIEIADNLYEEIAFGWDHL
ncbi:MAG: N-acetyltransferase family protein [Bacillota bacterium]